MEKKAIGIILFILLLVIVALRSIFYKLVPSEIIKVIIWVLSIIAIFTIFYYIAKSGLFTATGADIKIMFVVGTIIIAMAVFLLLTGGSNNIKSFLLLFVIGVIFILTAYSIKKRYSL